MSVNRKVTVPAGRLLTAPGPGHVTDSVAGIAISAPSA